MLCKNLMKLRIAYAFTDVQEWNTLAVSFFHSTAHL